MGRKIDGRIRDQLRRHAGLMAEFANLGEFPVSEETASTIAFQVIRGRRTEDDARAEILETASKRKFVVERTMQGEWVPYMTFRGIDEADFVDLLEWPGARNLILNGDDRGVRVSIRILDPARPGIATLIQEDAGNPGYIIMITDEI